MLDGLAILVVSARLAGTVYCELQGLKKQDGNHQNQASLIWRFPSCFVIASRCSVCCAARPLKLVHLLAGIVDSVAAARFGCLKEHIAPEMAVADSHCCVSSIAIKDIGQDQACLDPGRMAYIAYFRRVLTLCDRPPTFAQLHQRSPRHLPTPGWVQGTGTLAQSSRPRRPRTSPRPLPFLLLDFPISRSCFLSVRS